MPRSERGAALTTEVEHPPAAVWIAVLGGMGTLGLIAHNRAVGAWWRGRVPVAPGWVYKVGFWMAVGEHVRKAAKANRVARGGGLDRTAGAWTRQTLLLGFPSLRLLEAKLEAKIEAKIEGEPRRPRR